MRITTIERKRIDLEVYNQWSDLFAKNNWYDFTAISLEGEYSPYKGSVEITIGLLGFVLTATYTYDFSFVDNMTGLKDQVLAGLEAAHAGAEIQDPFGLLDALDADEDR